MNVESETVSVAFHVQNRNYDKKNTIIHALLVCECVPTCVCTSVTSGDACVRAQHVCVLV